MERENEQKISDIDIAAWNIGLYVRAAVASVLFSNSKYPEEPGSVSHRKAEEMTAKDHAQKFREFLQHYKRPPVKGGEQ